MLLWGLTFWHNTQCYDASWLEFNFLFPRIFLKKLRKYWFVHWVCVFFFCNLHIWHLIFRLLKCFAIWSQNHHDHIHVIVDKQVPSLENNNVTLLVWLRYLPFWHSAALPFGTVGMWLKRNDENGNRGYLQIALTFFLGGGFKYFLFSPLLGEMIQFG